MTLTLAPPMATTAPFQHTPPDADLLTRYATTKDPTAFAQLASRYVDFVHSAARRQTRSAPHLTDDVTQAVFILLSRKAAAIKPHTLPGWLFNTTRNAARNAMKLDRRRRKHEAAAAAHHARLAAASTSSSSTDDTPTWDDLAPELDRAVAKLGPGERDVLLLHYFQGHPLSAVASILNITEPAARKRSSRAVEKLRDLLTARGVTATTPAIVTLLHHNAVTPAPAAVSSSATGVAASAATTATTATTIATATTQAAALFKLKILAATLLAATLATTTVIATRNRATTPQVISADVPAAPAVTSADITFTVTPKSGPATGKTLTYDQSLGYLMVERQFGLVYSEWSDDKALVHARQGAPVALRLPAPPGASENIRRKVTEILTWSAAGGATRAPNLDARIDDVPCLAYHLSHLGGDPTPADVWIGPDHFPRRFHAVSPTAGTVLADCRFNTDVSAKLKSPFPADFTTAATANAAPPELIDATTYAAREYPLANAVVTLESAGHTVAVHRALRDPAGGVHLTISCRPTDATRALTGPQPFSTAQLAIASADPDASHRPVQLTAFAFGDTTAREDLLLCPPGAPVLLTVSVTSTDATYQALKSKGLPTNTRFKLTIPPGKITPAPMSRDQLLSQTYDHAAQIAPPADGGIIAPRPRGPAGPTPPALQPKEKFLTDVQKRLGI